MSKTLNIIRRFFLLAIVGLVGCSSFKQKLSLALTHGPIISEVRQTSALLWGRFSHERARIVVKLWDVNHKFLKSYITNSNKNGDNTFHVHLDDLTPNEKYFYQVDGQNGEGSFTTAGGEEISSKLRIAWSGDLGGQNVCRDRREGYKIFKTIHQFRPEIFIGLGDMIYADTLCKEIGRYGNAQVPGDFDKSYNLENFWKHWRYNRADIFFRELMKTTSYLAVWDDHEVINDFGPFSDTGVGLPYDSKTHLMPIGLKAFINYNPFEEGKLYRRFSWGKMVDIFILDTRQYRDANPLKDSQVKHKTMLGKQQLAWLKKGLRESTANFKIIISSVPLSIPTGFPLRGDGWANFNTDRGYENELLNVVQFLHKNSINKTIWLTTDVHFAEVFEYKPYSDDSQFILYEIAVGPLSAGLFPNKDFDTTLGPTRLFYYGADSFYDIKTYDDAKKWSNFGLLDFDGKGNLTIKIINTYGEMLYTLNLSK